MFNLRVIINSFCSYFRTTYIAPTPDVMADVRLRLSRDHQSLVSAAKLLSEQAEREYMTHAVNHVRIFMEQAKTEAANLRTAHEAVVRSN